jgi:F-type H+-transporting ATPase subunit b
MKFENIARRGLPFVVCASLMVLALSAPAYAADAWAKTDTYRIMNFTALVLILFFILRKPVANFFTDRIRLIKEQLEDLEEQKKEAEKKVAEYNQKLSMLDAEAEKIIQQYQQQGEAARENILKQAEASAAKMEEQARKIIEHEFAQAKLKLETELFDSAVEKAEDRMRSLITDEDQDRLVKEYLDKVVK